MSAFIIAGGITITGAFQVTHLNILWLFTVAMLGAALFLFLFTIWMRLSLTKKNRRVKQIEEELLPILFGFIEGEYDINDLKGFLQFDKQKYLLFEKVIIELLKNVDGDEAEKLRFALRAWPVYNYRVKQLKSDMEDLKIQACNYLRYAGKPEKAVVELLKNEALSDNSFLSFSAASALMGSGDINNKSFALEVIVSNQRLSSMAVIEMFHRFRAGGSNNAEEEAVHLIRILESGRTVDRHRATLISCLSESNLYYLTGQLHRWLNMHEYTWRNPDVITALIDSQRIFFNVDAADDIRQFRVHENKGVSAAAQKALSVLTSEDLMEADLYQLA
jgi:hypothetical protein